jgi:hypothetical protein
MIHTSFTFADLIATFRDSLLADSDIKQFCTDNFGKNLLTVIGHIRANELGIADAPFLMIAPSSVDTGMRSGQDSFHFDIDVAIAEKVFEDYQDNSANEMKGFYLLDQMVNLVINNLRNHAAGKNAVADSIGIVYDISNFYPLHVATLNVSVTVETVLGFSIGIN